MYSMHSQRQSLYDSYSGPLPLLLDSKDEKSINLQFIPNNITGFLPLQDPLPCLPEQFSKLEKILQDMPITKKDKFPGLLASGDLGPLINDGGLPDLSSEVEKITDCRLLHALFRDYTFLASAYLLEPCHLHRKKKLDGPEYGLGRPVLHKSIAKPLSIIAEKLSAKPFMEYALSYALYNYQRKDPTKGITFDNLSLIRTFEGSDDEAGFVLVHVDMVSHSGTLIQAAEDILSAGDNEQALYDGLSSIVACMRKINDSMEKMWSKSSPAGYESFRTFIMGITNQPMFPKGGVIYQGVSEEPFSFRGESGANDSMVPLIDNILGISDKMPDNPLTKILKDFRQYRPVLHERYLENVKSRSIEITEKCMKSKTTAFLLIKLLDFLREFRWRHWGFTKSYILAYSKHVVATGGSPIVRWLPNQLRVVLLLLVSSCQKFADKFDSKDITEIHHRAQNDLNVMENDIRKLELQFGSE